MTDEAKPDPGVLEQVGSVIKEKAGSMLEAFEQKLKDGGTAVLKSAVNTEDLYQKMEEAREKRLAKGKPEFRGEASKELYDKLKETHEEKGKGNKDQNQNQDDPKSLMDALSKAKFEYGDGELDKSIKLLMENLVEILKMLLKSYEDLNKMATDAKIFSNLGASGNQPLPGDPGVTVTPAAPSANDLPFANLTDDQVREEFKNTEAKLEAISDGPKNLQQAADDVASSTKSATYTPEKNLKDQQTVDARNEQKQEQKQEQDNTLRSSQKMKPGG